jgi:hypothetical protein
MIFIDSNSNRDYMYVSVQSCTYVRVLLLVLNLFSKLSAYLSKIVCVQRVRPTDV